MRSAMDPGIGIPGQCDGFAVDLDVNLVIPPTRGIPLFGFQIRDFFAGGNFCSVLLRVDGEIRGQCGCPVWRAGGQGVVASSPPPPQAARESAAGSASNSFWVIFRFPKFKNFQKIYHLNTNS